MKLASLSLLVSALMLFAATDASARAVAVGGHVLAPTASAGRSVTVPVLLSPKAERRLRAGTPMLRLVLARRARVTAPRPFGKGRVRVKAGSLRPGDRFTARIRIRPAQLRRARRQAVPTLRIRALRVTARASALSPNELTQLVLALQAQLVTLSKRVDELAAAHASDMAGLQAQLDALGVRVTALETGLTLLQGSLQGLADDITARLDGLDAGSADLAARLTAVEPDVQDLISALGGLLGVSGGLSLSSLETNIGSIEGDVADLDATVTAIAGRIATIETAVADLPALLSSLGTVQSGLTALDTRLGGVESDLGDAAFELDSIGAAVTGLSTDVNGLRALVGEQAIDIGALETGASELTTTVAGLTSDVGGLQTGFASLGTQVGALDTEVAGIQNDVAAICAASPLLCL
jgi:hypothetical protein